jgi:hypothetical protein
MVTTMRCCPSGEAPITGSVTASSPLWIDPPYGRSRLLVILGDCARPGSIPQSPPIGLLSWLLVSTVFLQPSEGGWEVGPVEPRRRYYLYSMVKNGFNSYISIYSNAREREKHALINVVKGSPKPRGRIRVLSDTNRKKQSLSYDLFSGSRTHEPFYSTPGCTRTTFTSSI